MVLNLASLTYFFVIETFSLFPFSQKKKNLLVLSQIVRVTNAVPKC